MNSRVIIGVYFGKLPSSIRLFLKSCSYNKKIDYIFFTDQKLDNVPANVTIIKMTLNEMSILASKKLNIENICLKKPYKCCDFKPAYGVIFEDYIKNYQFWGYCDFDLIFGNIDGVINKDVWDKYDRILPLGHLSFYRNTKEVNTRYKKEGSKVGSYLKVFTTDKSYVFDESGGITSIYKKNNFASFEERVFADISIIYKRFRLALKDKNYAHQVFYWENGHIYRAYIDTRERKICKDEFAYIHFKRRKRMIVFVKNIEECNSFFITYAGFFPKKVGLPTAKEIRQYNKYRGRLFETLECLKYKFIMLCRRMNIKK